MMRGSMQSCLTLFRMSPAEWRAHYNVEKNPRRLLVKGMKGNDLTVKGVRRARSSFTKEEIM